MASVQLLTQGTLLKLLQSMNIDKQVVVEEQRSIVLQVIGIVPALSGPDLWSNRGFYIQLSDSTNSTYVSFPESANSTYDVGQFVHVDRFHFDHPNSVPRASGLRPLHPFRVHPCLGSPQPLIIRVSANGKGFLIQSAPPDLLPPPTTVPLNEEKSTVVTEVNTKALSVKRRFLSPMSGRKINGINRGLMEHETSTSMKPPGSRPSSPSMRRSKSRPSSPIPSKCEVPGLVAAKDESRNVVKEPGIVIPSRYRQPSPVTVRKVGASPMNRRASSGASPMSKRVSSSPARRLSGGFRIPPSVSDTGSKKKMVIGGGISKASEVSMASGKSGRKSWDDVSKTLNDNSERKEIGKSKKLHKTKNEDVVKTQVAILARRLSDVSGKQNSEEEVSSAGEKPSPVRKVICSLSSKKTTRQPPKITVHDRKWTDGSVPLDVLPNELAKLGKEALLRKNIAATAAVEALEEACSTESLLRNLSLFSDLYSSAKILSPLPTIESFLLMYHEVVRCISVAESLISRTNDNLTMERHKSISLWIDAALATDLEIISLLKSGTSLAKQKSTLPPLELSRKVTNNNLPKRSSGFPSKNQSTKGIETGVWTPGKGVSETVDLGLALQSEMVVWFLQFVEQALDAGFYLIGDSCNAATNSTALTSQDKNGQVTAVLSHLKRVNEWLDCVGMNLEEVKNSLLTETIEGLKKKIYGFVIRHVGSVFDNSISLGGS